MTRTTGPVEERRPPITPQLAVRVAVLGGVAFVLFAIVFFRLWFLQVLSGEDYVSQARDNRVRKVRIEAPRGDIVDRHGTVLVKTRVAPVVQIVPSSLPDSVLEQSDEFRKLRGEAEKARLAAADQLRSLERDIQERRGGPTRTQRRERRRLSRAARQAAPVAVPPVPVQELELRRLYRRLGRVIDVRPKTIHERVIEGVAELPYSNVTIRTAVDRTAFNYIRERKEEFPGVAVEKQYLRDYPHEELAAQLFGTTREISPDELELERYRGVEPGTRIGADGIEESYDEYLRGTDGFTRVVINALGSRDDRRRMSRREPRQGQRLRLTLDLNLQRSANDALARAVGAASRYGAKAGAFVAMDPRNGEVLAPRLVPELRRQRVRQAALPGALQRAVERGARRPALQPRDLRDVSDRLDLQAGDGDGGARGGHHHAVDADRRRRRVRARRPRLQERQGRLLRHADAAQRDHRLLGRLLLPARRFEMNGRGPVLQEWARRLGVGRRTGIDIPGEFPGLVPDPSGATRATRSTCAAPRRPRWSRGRRRRCSPAAASSARGRRATTSTSPSARATCRRRRCRSPPPTRRSSTAARSCRGRTWASGSRTATA